MEKIRHLKISNMARITNIDIVPSGNLQQVAGENAAGKTTLIKSLVACFGGEVPALRDGQEKGEISVTTDNFDIKVVTTPKGDKMTVTDKESHKKIRSPKTMLKELFGKRNFDPTNFLLAKDKDQINTLLGVISIPIDNEAIKRICGNNVNFDGTPVDIINTAYSEIETERRIINRELKSCQAISDKYQDVAEVQHVELEGLFALKEKAIKRDSLDMLIENEKNTLREKLEDIERLKLSIEQHENEAKELGPYKLEEIDEQISIAKENNQKVGLYKEKVDAQNNLTKYAQQSASLTDKLQQLISYKNEIMHNTKMPIPGLDIKSGQVYYQGFPLCHASGSEQMLVALSIAAEEIPKNGLQAMFILDPPQLDKGSWATIEKFANERNIQLWIAKVEDNPENSLAQIILHEGRAI